MDTDQRSWWSGRPATSPFALPRGRFGRFAGRFMRRTNQITDLVDLLDVRSGHRVLEVGFGGGGLIREIADRTDAELIYGVDPSTEMVELATSYNRRDVRSGRVRLSVGSADATWLPDQCADLVVTVNTVAIWPDLGQGVRELRRVVRADGRVVVAWHGGRSPGTIQRRLRLPAEAWGQVEAALGAEFGTVTRAECANLDVVIASAHAA